METIDHRSGPERCWCGRTDAEVFWRGSFRRTNRIEACVLLRCRQCGTVRTGPQSGVVGSHGDGPGGSFLNEEPNAWERTNAAIVLRQGLDGPLLEVGANTGRLLSLLRETGREGLHGLEPNPAAVAEARRGGLDVHEGWFLADQTPPGPFRLLVMSHVLEHIPDLTGALELASSRLAVGGGRLLVFLPNIESWAARADLGRWPPLNPMDHLWHFGAASLRRLLETRTDWRVEEIFTTPLRRRRLNSLRRGYQACREVVAAWCGRAEQLVAIVRKT